MRNIFGGNNMRIKGIIRRIILPFLRIVVIIGMVLCMIEILIRIFLMLITWILFGIGINNYCEPFTLQFWENVFEVNNFMLYFLSGYNLKL